MLSSIRPKNRVIYAYLAIPVALYVFSVFIPLLTAGYYSFFEWKGGPNKTFIGIENYLVLLKDKMFWESFSHNIYLVVACIIGQVGIAFVFVMMLSSNLVKLKGIHRTFGFFPSTVSAVSIGFIWTMVYDYRRGILNWFLELIGKGDAAKVWLNEPKLVMLLVSIPLIWQFIGYYMVILLSATTSIDKEIIESSQIDGANAFQRAIHIVLPLIKNTLLVCITLCVAGNMKAFDHIFVMTKGGPGMSSMVMALYGYTVSFNQQNMGYGSAISIGIFVISLLVIGGVQLFVRTFTKEKGESA
ncbi:MAG TPA: sugar ABC transporter permease [Clostridiales bacterium]|nr:sugar ABC transporter permease [Clostridiales bacterium]